MTRDELLKALNATAQLSWRDKPDDDIVSVGTWYDAVPGWLPQFAAHLKLTVGDIRTATAPAAQTTLTQALEATKVFVLHDIFGEYIVGVFSSLDVAESVSKSLVGHDEERYEIFERTLDVPDPLDSSKSTASPSSGEPGSGADE